MNEVETRGESRGVIGKHNLRTSVPSESHGERGYSTLPTTVALFGNKHGKRSLTSSFVAHTVALSFSPYLSGLSLYLALGISP